MRKMLAKTGNSYAVILDKPLLEQTGIDENTPLEITTNGDSIVVTPVRDPEDTERFKEMMESIGKRYARTFKRLAE